MGRIIKGGSVYRDGRFVYNVGIEVSEEGRIVSFNAGDPKQGDTVYDASGKYIIPGFVDLHCHGAMGSEFNGCTTEDIENIARFFLKHGTTAILASTSTQTMELLQDSVKCIADYMDNADKHLNGARIVGIHLEGPIISGEKKGAQNAAGLQPAELSVYEQLVGESEDKVRLVAIAPELPGAVELITELVRRGKRVHIAHTTANAEQCEAAIAAGATGFTHFYNAMTGLNHREPGCVGVGLTEKNVTLELITDFIHVHPRAIKLAINSAGYEHIALITDSISANGLGDGEYGLAGKTIYVKNGVARIAAGNLAGSTHTLDRALRNVVGLGYPLEQVVAMLTEVPAKAVGVDAGVLREGGFADMVILDSELNITDVLLGGVKVED